MTDLDFSALTDDQVTELFSALLAEAATRSDTVQVAWKSLYEAKRAEIASELDAAKVLKQAKADAKADAEKQEREANAAKQAKNASLKSELAAKLHEVAKANVQLDHKDSVKLLEQLRPFSETGCYSVGVRAALESKEFAATREEAEAIVAKSSSLRVSMISELTADSIAKEVASLERKISNTHKLRPMKFEIWEKNGERRVYASFVDAKFGDNAISYFETGNNLHKPGSIEVNDNMSCVKACEWCQLLLSKFGSVKVYDSSEWV